MSAEDWFLGIDLGTGSCKAVAVDGEARVLGFSSMVYPAAETKTRWEEQDPEVLLGAAVDSARHAAQGAGLDPRGCQGVSLGGALHSVMVLDENDRPLTGVITWADPRAGDQARRVRSRPLGQRLYEETGCPPHAMYPLYKILWLRENRPEVFSRARRFLSAKEYVFWRFTGESLVDYSVASGSGLLHLRSLQWNPFCLEMAGIRAEQLSRPCPPRQAAGPLAKDVSDRMGLAGGVPVILGSSDAVNSSLGAGAVLPTQATCMVGTSGALRLIQPRPILDPRGRTWCYAMGEGRWLVGGAINNGGVALSWLRDALNQAMFLQGRKEGLTFDQVLHLAAQAGPGAGGVLCLPFFAGERSPNWNLNARAAFLGLTLEHGLPHLARSLVEGIGFRLRSIREALQETGVRVDEILASGGFTRSEFWLQVTADVLEARLRVPRWGETSALGAALWVMWAVGRAGSLAELTRLIPPGRSVCPRAETAAVYRRAYALYSRACGCLEPLFQEMGEPARP